jgi:hypothetical protein
LCYFLNKHLELLRKDRKNWRPGLYLKSETKEVLCCGDIMYTEGSDRFADWSNNIPSVCFLQKKITSNNISHLSILRSLLGPVSSLRTVTFARKCFPYHSFPNLSAVVWENCTDEGRRHPSHNEVSSCVWLGDKALQPDRSSADNICSSNETRGKKVKYYGKMRRLCRTRNRSVPRIKHKESTKYLN